MRYRHLGLLALLLAACSPDPSHEVASVSKAMPNLPLPPQAEVVSRAGSPTALQITFRSAVPPDGVLAYYRGVLSTGGWSLESDTPDASGASALYAVKDGHPLWVRIRRNPGASGSLVEVSGAVVEAAPAADSAGPAN
jgi:hypothetical protein